MLQPTELPGRGSGVVVSFRPYSELVLTYDIFTVGTEFGTTHVCDHMDVFKKQE